MSPRYKVLTQNPGKNIAKLKQEITDVTNSLRIAVDNDLEQLDNNLRVDISGDIQDLATNLGAALDNDAENSTVAEANGYIDLAKKFDQIEDLIWQNNFDTNYVVNNIPTKTLRVENIDGSSKAEKSKYDYDIVAVCSVGNVYGYTASEYEGDDEDKHKVNLNRDDYPGYLPEKAGGRNISKFMLSNGGSRHIIIDSGKGSNTSELLIWNNKEYHIIQNNDNKIIDASIDAECNKVVSIYENGDIIVSSWNGSSYDKITIETTYNIKAVGCSNSGTKFVIWTTTKVVIYSLLNGVWEAKKIDVPFTTIDNNIYFNNNILLVLNKDTKKLHIYKVDLTNVLPSLEEVRIIDNVIKYKSHSSARSLCFIQPNEGIFNTKDDIIFYKTNDDWKNYYMDETIQIDTRNYRQQGDSYVIDLCCDHNSRLYFLTKIFNSYFWSVYTYKLYVTTSNVDIGLKNPSDLDNITMALGELFGYYQKVYFTQDVDDKSLFVLEGYVAPYTTSLLVPCKIFVNGSYDNGFTFDASGEYQYEDSGGIERAIVDGSYNMLRDKTLRDSPFNLSSRHKYDIKVRLEGNNISINIQHLEALSLPNQEKQKANVTFRFDSSTYDGEDTTDFRIAGDFLNNWGTPTPLILNSEDGIYEYTIELSSDTNYQYKFMVGEWTNNNQEEYNPGTPGTITSGSFTNRLCNFTADDILADGNVILEIASWIKM